MKRLFLALMTVAVLGACSDGALSGTTGGTFAGTYRLITIDGDPLPVFVESNFDFDTYIDDGALVLRSDRTYTVTFRYADVYSDDQVVYDTDVVGEGTWRVSGSNLILTEDSDGSTITAFRSGNILTAQSGSTTYEFQRE
jgi:hypothetical protein